MPAIIRGYAVHHPVFLHLLDRRNDRRDVRQERASALPLSLSFSFFFYFSFYFSFYFYFRRTCVRHMTVICQPDWRVGELCFLDAEPLVEFGNEQVPFPCNFVAANQAGFFALGEPSGNVGATK